MVTVPSAYYLPPTEHSPNNPLPVLHYRNVLPEPRTEDEVTRLLTAHKWEKRVGVSMPHQAGADMQFPGYMGCYLEEPLSSQLP